MCQLYRIYCYIFFKHVFFLISDQKITEFVFLFPFILNEFFLFFFYLSFSYWTSFLQFLVMSVLNQIILKK